MRMRLMVGVAVLLLATIPSGAAQRDALDRVGETLQQLKPGTKLLIFAGQDHDDFLGCLNCSSFVTDSVHNSYGQFGNPFSGKSLRNHYSTYGNPFSPYSPCNKLSVSPPVVVDPQGTFYGELTLNTIRPKRITNDAIQIWLRLVCSD